VSTNGDDCVGAKWDRYKFAFMISIIRRTRILALHSDGDIYGRNLTAAPDLNLLYQFGHLVKSFGLFVEQVFEKAALRK